VKCSLSTSSRLVTLLARGLSSMDLRNGSVMYNRFRVSAVMFRLVHTRQHCDA
jgi:hypothetical protein